MLSDPFEVTDICLIRTVINRSDLPLKIQNWAYSNNKTPAKDINRIKKNGSRFHVSLCFSFVRYTKPLLNGYIMYCLLSFETRKQ